MSKFLLALAVVAALMIPASAYAGQPHGKVCTGSLHVNAAARTLYSGVFAGHVTGGNSADWITDPHGQFQFTGGTGVPYWAQLTPHDRSVYLQLASAVASAACGG